MDSMSSSSRWELVLRTRWQTGGEPTVRPVFISHVEVMGNQL